MSEQAKDIEDRQAVRRTILTAFDSTPFEPDPSRFQDPLHAQVQHVVSVISTDWETVMVDMNYPVETAIATIQGVAGECILRIEHSLKNLPTDEELATRTARVLVRARQCLLPIEQPIVPPNGNDGAWSLFNGMRVAFSECGAELQRVSEELQVASYLPTGQPQKNERANADTEQYAPVVRAEDVDDRQRDKQRDMIAPAQQVEMLAIPGDNVNRKRQIAGDVRQFAKDKKLPLYCEDRGNAKWVDRGDFAFAVKEWRKSRPTEVNTPPEFPPAAAPFTSDQPPLKLWFCPGCEKEAYAAERPDKCPGSCAHTRMMLKNAVKTKK